MLKVPFVDRPAHTPCRFGCEGIQLVSIHDPPRLGDGFGEVSRGDSAFEDQVPWVRQPKRLGQQEMVRTKRRGVERHVPGALRLGQLAEES